MSTRLESLIVELRADVAGYHQQLQKSVRSTEGWATSTRRNVGSVGQAFKGLLPALGAGAIVAGLTAITRKTLNTAEETQRMAQSLGSNVEAVQELTFAFREFGSDSNDVSDALNTLADRAQDAQAGTKSFIDDFKLLGVSVDDLRGKRPEQLFDLMAERVAGIEDPTQRAAGVVRIFGDDLGRRLLPLLMEGADGLARFRQEARDAGAVLGEETVAKMADANREFRKLRNIVDAQLASSVASNAENLQLLAQAMASVGGTAISVTGHVAGFTRWVGEELAVALHGVSSDDLPRLTGQLQNARTQLERVEGALNSPNLKAAESIRKGLGDRLRAQADALSQEIEILEAQIGRAQERQRQQRAAADDPASTRSGGGAAGAAADQALSATEFKLSRAAALHRESLMDEEQREIEQSQKIIDLQQERFNRIHEMALQAAGRDREVERFRFEQEQVKLQEDLERMRDRGLLTQELEQQFREAREEQEATHQAKLTEIGEEEAEKRIETEKQLRDAKLQIAEDILGIGVALAKEDSKARRAMLATQKAIALARALIAMGEAMAEANTVPFPANILAVARAVQLGTQAVATIRGVNVEGVAHAGMSSIPREGTYLLNRGERVVAPEQNKDLTNFMRDGGSSRVNVTIIEAAGSNPKTVEHSRGPNGEMNIRIIEQTVRGVIQNDVSSGRGVAGTLQQTYGLQRRGSS